MRRKRTILRNPTYGGVIIWDEPDADHDWFNCYPFWDELAYYQDLR